MYYTQTFALNWLDYQVFIINNKYSTPPVQFSSRRDLVPPQAVRDDARVPARAAHRAQQLLWGRHAHEAHGHHVPEYVSYYQYYYCKLTFESLLINCIDSQVVVVTMPSPRTQSVAELLDVRSSCRTSVFVNYKCFPESECHSSYPVNVCRGRRVVFLCGSHQFFNKMGK